MASNNQFTLVKVLAEQERADGLERLLLALYETSSGHRYIALSTQERPSPDAPWARTGKGVTIRRAEVAAVLHALSDVPWTAEVQGELSHRDYAAALDWR